MGLNESFAQVRTQLLLLEPEASINKAFALVTQEVEQRSVPTSSLTSQISTAFAVRNASSSSNTQSLKPQNSTGQNKRRDRPICTYCNIPGAHHRQVL